jgi:hypothetical protein
VADFPLPATRISVGGFVSRRAIIAIGWAGFVGLAASGCTVNNPVSHHPAPKTRAGLAPDVAVATRALAEIKAVRTAATRTLTRFPATRSLVPRLVQMHEAHEVSLADAVPPGAATGPGTPAPHAVARQREAALRNLRAREQRLHDTLDALALRAQSGDFARLLASMGAAVDQQLAVWPS